MPSLLKHLIPNPLPSARSPSDNAIHHLNILIFGKPNTGKTSIASAIAQTVSAKYPAWVRRSSRDLPVVFKLLKSFEPTGYRAVVIIEDDMTKALDKLSGTLVIEGSTIVAGERMNRKSYWLDKWYDIRGELKKRGMNEGLAVMVTTTHRFYATPIDMRADVDLILARSTGTPGTFDARFVERVLGKETYAQLRRYETMALSDRTMLGWTGWATKMGSGLVFIEPVKSPVPVSVSDRPGQARNPWHARWRVANWVGVMALWIGAVLRFLAIANGYSYGV